MVLTREVGAKTQKHLAIRVAMARFPFRKTFEGFDFEFRSSINAKLIRELAAGRYVEGGDNVLLLGPPDVGKSHLAVALGLTACEQGPHALHDGRPAHRQPRQGACRQPPRRETEAARVAAGLGH
jgi:DNA replication protein DnaC